MRFRWQAWLGIAVLGLVFAGCESVPITSLTAQERAMRDFDFQGIRIGSRSGALATFPQVQRVPLLREGMVVYEIFNPTPQVSKAIAFYHEDRLRKLELRYFDGPGARTLQRAGGWAGIRDYLIARYGPPSRFGTEAEIVTNQPGLKAEFAKFNGVWIFSRINRQLNYVAMADNRGGVGVVTVQDTTPLVQPSPTPGPRGQTTTRTVVVSQTAPEPTPAPTPVRPNPGF